MSTVEDIEDTVAKRALDQSTQELVEGLFTDKPQVTDAYGNALPNHYKRNVKRSVELELIHKPQAVDVIIKELFSRKENGTLMEGEDGLALYFAVRFLGEFAKPKKHGNQINKIVRYILYHHPNVLNKRK